MRPPKRISRIVKQHTEKLAGDLRKAFELGYADGANGKAPEKIEMPHEVDSRLYAELLTAKAFYTDGYNKGREVKTRESL